MGYVKWSYDTLNTFATTYFGSLVSMRNRPILLKMFCLPQTCTGLRVTECREW